jgi:hypothetical protein
MAPIAAARTGTQAYRQSEPPLPAMGSAACGARSRAGLIAYPVVPPSEMPMPQTTQLIRYEFTPAAPPPERTNFEFMAPATMTSAKVAMISRADRL